MKRALQLLLVMWSILALNGCAGPQNEFQKAFDAEHSLKQNQADFSQPPERMAKLVTQTFIQQGFAVESADQNLGIIKAVRKISDKENAEITYNVQVTSNLTEQPGATTNVMLAASQQTTLRHAETIWWHLLWIFPIIPIGTEYQSVILKEGTITDNGFYTDFFTALKLAEAKYAAAVKVAEAKKAIADKIAAEQAAKLKAEADAKAAEEKAALEKIALAKAAAEKEAAEKIALAKAAQEKAEAEKIALVKAEAEKAEAERIASEKALAEKVEAERVAAAAKQAEVDAAEKAAAEKSGSKAKKTKVK